MLASDPGPSGLPSQAENAGEGQQRGPQILPQGVLQGPRALEEPVGLSQTEGRLGGGVGQERRGEFWMC